MYLLFSRQVSSQTASLTLFQWASQSNLPRNRFAHGRKAQLSSLDFPPVNYCTGN